MITTQEWQERLKLWPDILLSALEELLGWVERSSESSEARVVVVGGAVRDLAVGIVAKDFDVEVYGVEKDQLEAILLELWPHYQAVGVSFGVYKVVLEPGLELDIALPRTEEKIGAGHTKFLVKTDPYLNFSQGARRRDFTINAIGLDWRKKQIFDPYNGLKDLEEKRLKIVDERSFIEDPLRVWRAMQFSARFELKVDPNTVHLIKEIIRSGELETLSPERVTAEWEKLLTLAIRPSIGINLARDWGLLKRFFPTLSALWDTPQEPEWHPEGDVGIHTMLVVDQAARLVRLAETADHELKAIRARRLLVTLSALVHDFGKPLVTKMEEGRVRSRGHEEAAAQPIKEFCHQLCFGKELEDKITRIAADHLKTTILYLQWQKGELTSEQYENAIRRLLRRLGPVNYQDFLLVTEADKRGRGFPDADLFQYSEGERFKEAVIAGELVLASKTPLIKGGEIMSLLGMAPGTRVGEVMKAVEKARDEGQIKTKSGAVRWLKKNFQQ